MAGEGEDLSPRMGQIVAFYSFKGGTGRTMALANVAWILAASGKRVLVADWDLESPGLRRFFEPFMDAGASDRPGVVDLVRRYAWAIIEAQIDPEALHRDESSRQAALPAIDARVDEHVGRLDSYVIPLSWQFPDGGALHFLSPGKQANGDYQATLSALDWDNFYDNLHGDRFLTALRAFLKSRYDYVLIDSRPGHGDVADICTMHLPDMVIDCFTLATQSIDGAAQIARKIRDHSDHDITILPVPMRIDHAHKEKVDAGLEFAANLFEGLPAGMSEEQRREYWAAVAVPYRPSYAYEETLAALSERPGTQDGLLPYYEKIAALIAADEILAENDGVSADVKAQGQASVGSRHDLAFEGASGVQVGDHNVQHNYYYGQQDPRTTGPQAAGDRLPYRGLDPFEEVDHEFFFGRDDAINEVVHRMAATRSGIVVVSGASGIGKSSLLRAGVLPRLRRNGLPENAGAKNWPCLLFTPGATPLDELAAQMAVIAGISVHEARPPLAANPQLFGRLARQAVLAHARRYADLASPDSSDRQRLVLIIDQFEHLFTLCRDEDERRAFITALASAAASPEPSVLVVLGLRADHESRCAEYLQLAAAIGERYLLAPMAERDLELAITQPAKQARSSVERGLVERVLAEARGSTGALPWVSHALVQAWKARAGEVLTVADYDQAGGIVTAAVAQAHVAYDALTENQRDTARQVFLQLGATGPDGSDRAIPATWDQLHASIGSPELRAVLDVFANDRIITLTGDGAEISHVALLTDWPLLRDIRLADRHRPGYAPGNATRVIVDIGKRRGELFLIVTVTSGRRYERPVSWVGSPGKRLLVARDAASTIREPAALADAVDEGRATEEEVTQYGQLLFEAAFGQDLWHSLLRTSIGRPYLELAIRGSASDDQAAMQALRWEALHDGTVPLAALGDAREDSPSISIVRIVSSARRPEGIAHLAGFQQIRGLPRVLFAVGSPFTDPAAQAEAEISGIMRQLHHSGVSVRSRVLESATLAAIRREIAAFEPDVIHLITHGRQFPDGRIRLPFRAEHSAGPPEEWVTAEELLSAFPQAGHTLRMVVLSACQTASASTPPSASNVQDHVDALPLASRVVAGGVPVVIAMAGDIGDPECRAFTGALMASVLQGEPLAQAMAKGRQASLLEAGSGATHWTLPTAFLAEDVRSDVPLVDAEAAQVVRRRIDVLGLNQEPMPFDWNEFVEAMDRLLDGSDPLNVLVGYTPGSDRQSDDVRLLHELGAQAVRAGVLPVMLGPFDHDASPSLDQLVSEASAAIRRVRAGLGLVAVPNRELDVLIEEARSDTGPLDVSSAILAELNHLVANLPETDPMRARADSEPRAVLLCPSADEWQESLEGLPEMLGRMALHADQGSIPVVLTGANVGAFRDVLRGRWHGQPWLQAIPLDRQEDTRLAEETDEIRTLVAAGEYWQAGQRLMHLATEDPQQTEPVRLELGFITLPDPDRSLVAAAWSAIAAGHSVQSLLAGDDVQPFLAGDDVQSLSAANEDPSRSGSSPGTSDDGMRPVIEASIVRQRTPTATAPRRSPQHSGAVLEQATVDLFTRFFAVDPDTILSRLRRQGAGAQFGHDIELECTAADSPAVHCHVECKNLDRRVTVGDIAGKLAQQKYHHHGTQIDHWILISPHHDGANDLPAMLDAWDREGEYPFSVQVWSPETRVREMFALEPAVYEAVYGRPPTQEEVSASAEAAELIRRRLAPRLRVDAVWRRYLEQPGAFCFVNEDSRHFDGLYGRHLPLKVTDERGALLGGTLMDKVIDWAGDAGSAPMLLLADFGEGKSVFTYCLTRRLCEEFRAAPDGALFPLRIPLREFRDAGSARGLLERRLTEVGATLAQWRALTKQVRTLAILDGFDEMSADLSPAAITVNLRDIRSCLTELSGSKVLVTSRQRVLDGSRDWKRILDRLGQPLLMRIASGPRRQRVQYLEQFATDEASARVLATLRSLYDPIGLAAKPLFLEMIKETLRDLPDDTFSETVLYDTYINKSLRTKWELLVDPGEDLTSDELIENLKEILEDVAVRLQEANGAYIYLRDYQDNDRGKIAELLWKMRDDQIVPRDQFPPTAQDDAANRVGIRSLLKAVSAPDADRWPVDFFHRSMREYFVARAIVHCLNKDARRARQILSAAPLLPEIAHFAATVLRSRQDDAALATLEKLACSATTERSDAYLGGNALTLLHGAGGLLAERDWSGLRLDHARLRGADLRGARLAGSSLRHANLDNANLEEADLTQADLEGVRLEETSQVLAVTALPGNRVIAAYEDRSLREWRRQPGAGWESQVVATLDYKTDQLQVTPLGRVMASGEGMLTVLDVAAGGADGSADSAESSGSGVSSGASEASSVRSAFRTSSRCRAAVLGARTALFTEEGDGGQLLVTWLDMATARALKELDIDETVMACAQLDEVMFALATSNGIHVIWLLGEGRKAVTVADLTVTCLSVRADGDGALLAAGHHDGSVSLTQLSPADTGVVAPKWMRHMHDGPVTDILLDAEEQVITGSTDRKVFVTPVSAIRSDSPASDKAESAVQRLHLTLRCKGVRFDGVRTEREQEKLRRYAQY
jgi:MinD-like ATPase involved in chromosome partitioning or flagellar assembly